MAAFNHINKLRFFQIFQILRPQLGGAFEDEQSSLTTKSDIERFREQVQRDQQTLVIRALTIWSVLVAAAVAIAQLF